MQTEKCGTLYIVATPIGNLKDLSQRAIETLEQVDWIAAEDTRHSQRLLQHLGIKKPLTALHDHNEQQKREFLHQKLQAGEQGALISDAGTPLISDPGYHLVHLLRKEGVRVVPIPGPSAIITALSAAGLPTDRFTFEGFLPAKSQKRLQTLQALKTEPRTLVFYESPHRLLESLQAFSEVFSGDRPMVVARELTKQFEQFVSGSVQEVLNYFSAHPDKVRGEFVIMLQGAPKVEKAVASGEGLIRLLLEQGLPVKQVAQIVSAYLGLKKNAVYQQVLAFKQADEDNSLASDESSF